MSGPGSESQAVLGSCKVHLDLHDWSDQRSCGRKAPSSAPSSVRLHRMDLQQPAPPGPPRMPEPTCPPRNYSSPRLIRGLASAHPEARALLLPSRLLSSLAWNHPDHPGRSTSGNPLNWATLPPRRWLSWQPSTTMPAEPKRKQLSPQHPKRPTWTPGAQCPGPRPPAADPVLTSTLQPMDLERPLLCRASSNTVVALLGRPWQCALVAVGRRALLEAWAP